MVMGDAGERSAWKPARSRLARPTSGSAAARSAVRCNRLLALLP